MVRCHPVKLRGFVQDLLEALPGDLPGRMFDQFGGLTWIDRDVLRGDPVTVDMEFAWFHKVGS